MTVIIVPTVEAGDFIQARKETPNGIISLEFTVTEVDDSGVSGSQLGDLEESEGWSFEVITKGDPHLPTTLSDLAIVLQFSPSSVVRAVGPLNGSWISSEGHRIPVESVLAWEPWADYEARLPRPDGIELITGGIVPSEESSLYTNTGEPYFEPQDLPTSPPEGWVEEADITE